MLIGARQVVLHVLGMKDNSCRERVVEVLGRVRGVREVNVSLIRARATVTYEPPCEPAELIGAVESVGCVARLNGAGDAS